MFESNFNGSWDQYIDSFSFAIPSGLDMFWKYNVGYPKSIPLHGFYDYIRFNQVETDHYFNAYPCASANDVKTAVSLLDNLKAFTDKNTPLNDDDFLVAYNQFLHDNQDCLGSMGTAPGIQTQDYTFQGPVNHGE
jgi:hypothetical protein